MPATAASRLFDLTGRTALITGSSQGLGFAIARGLAEAGAAMVINGRDQPRLDRAAATLAKDGLSVRSACFDVTDQAALADAVAGLGAIDILVNNAGVQRRGPLESIDEATWRLVIDTNLTGVFLMTRAVVPAMIERRAGKIINVSSQTSEVALVKHAAYMASKNGLNALTKVMTVEWAQYNIQSNAVCPTVIMTPMGEMVWGDPKIGDPMRARIPLGRFGKVVEIADLVLFLASPASDLITGQAIFADGGYTAV
jgi:NAD(P)-dependent dehydrogenase (short-subunit alcohol dehydrogenase family)